MSALQDLQNGKKLEIDATLGYAVSEGQKRGLSIPTLDVCYSLMKGINTSNMRAASLRIWLHESLKRKSGGYIRHDNVVSEQDWVRH